MSVFGVILVRIQSECVKIRTRITPNTVNFYAVRGANNCKKEKRFVALSYLADYFVKKENKAFIQKFPELVQLKAFSSHLHVLLIFQCLKNSISSSS